jgi:energy-coupling factor transporter ATP-binding protein EcfA2
MVKELTIFEHASGPGGTAGDHDAVPMAAPVAGGAASDGMPRAAGLADEETIMMVGNPGMGKSTLLNQLCAAVRFKSGEGAGDHGCTTQLQWHEEPPANGWPKINLCDTPGLADLSMAEVAAAQIKAALERKPNARLLFVMKENDNRVAPSDVATVQAVLDAIDLDPQDKQNRYGIVFNQITPPRYKKLFSEANPADAMRRRVMLQQAANSGKYQTSSFLYIKREDELESEDNALLGADHELTRRLRAFALMVYPISIPRVVEVEWRDSEAREAQAKAEMDQKIGEMQAMNQQQIDELNTRFLAETKQREEEVGRMLQQQQASSQQQIVQQQQFYAEQRKADQDAAQQSMDRLMTEQASQRAELQAVMDKAREESQEAARLAEERTLKMLAAQERERTAERERAERQQAQMNEQLRAAQEAAAQSARAAQRAEARSTSSCSIM